MTLCPFSIGTTYLSFVYSSLTVVVVCVYFNFFRVMYKTKIMVAKM